jgi:hypothetical protein
MPALPLVAGCEVAVDATGRCDLVRSGTFALIIRVEGPEGPLALRVPRLGAPGEYDRPRIRLFLQGLDDHATLTADDVPRVLPPKVLLPNPFDMLDGDGRILWMGIPLAGDSVLLRRGATLAPPQDGTGSATKWYRGLPTQWLPWTEVDLVSSMAVWSAWSLEDRLMLIEHVLEGLAALHRHGLVHGDVRPHHVMTSAGNTKPADFALAEATSGAHVRWPPVGDAKRVVVVPRTRTDAAGPPELGLVATRCLPPTDGDFVQLGAAFALLTSIDPATAIPSVGSGRWTREGRLLIPAAADPGHETGEPPAGCPHALARMPSPASDVYSAGALALMLLLGRDGRDSTLRAAIATLTSSRFLTNAWERHPAVKLSEAICTLGPLPGSDARVADEAVRFAARCLCRGATLEPSLLRRVRPFARSRARGDDAPAAAALGALRRIK